MEIIPLQLYISEFIMVVMLSSAISTQGFLFITLGFGLEPVSGK